LALAGWGFTTGVGALLLEWLRRTGTCPGSSRVTGCCTGPLPCTRLTPEGALQPCSGAGSALINNQFNSAKAAHNQVLVKRCCAAATAELRTSRHRLLVDVLERLHWCLQCLIDLFVSFPSADFARLLKPCYVLIDELVRTVPSTQRFDVSGYVRCHTLGQTPQAQTLNSSAGLHPSNILGKALVVLHSPLC
jgi:hypothetical protein